MLQEFNLYREAKDQYDLLIPIKELGLVLISLYLKYESGSFTEEQIIDVINNVYKDLGREPTRTEYERNNNIILKLQEFFLWRDELRKVYKFKKYGEDFCKRINKRLQESYTPAKIKRLFDYLYNTLKLAIEKDEFNQWVEDHFDARNNELAEQIEILDQQVSESVKEFRSKIKEGKFQIIQLLEEIEIGLDIIKKQTNELKKAFQTTYEIDDVLTNILEQQNIISYNEKNIEKISNFNEQVRSHLEHVSNRIEKIKPRIREFIYEFNQKDFDRKTDLFLKFLLKDSHYLKIVNKRVLLPPKGVSLFKIKDNTILPRFNIVPSKNIGPKPPIEIPRRIINQEMKDKLINKTEIQLFERTRVRFWTETAIKEIEEVGFLAFSPLFYKILREEGKLGIAVKTAHRLLRICIKNTKYKVNIEPEIISDQSFFNTSLWKMEIQKL